MEEIKGVSYNSKITDTTVIKNVTIDFDKVSDNDLEKLSWYSSFAPGMTKEDVMDLTETEDWKEIK